MQAAGGLHGGGDAFGDRPLVERARAVARDRRQRVGEVALDQHVAGREHACRRLEEDLRRRRPAREPRLRARQRVRDVVLDRNAVARERDRRRDQLRPA